MPPRGSPAPPAQRHVPSPPAPRDRPTAPPGGSAARADRAAASARAPRPRSAARPSPRPGRPPPRLAPAATRRPCPPRAPGGSRPASRASRPAPHQLHRDALGNLVEWQHYVYSPGLDGRARHARHDRRFFVLRQPATPGIVNGAQPVGPVAAHPRQHHADTPRAEDLRHRAEQRIGGAPPAPQPAPPAPAGQGTPLAPPPPPIIIPGGPPPPVGRHPGRAGGLHPPHRAPRIAPPH